MRVLHIVSSDNFGGAARAARSVHNILKAHDVDSFMLVGKKNLEDEHVLKVDDPLLKLKVTFGRKSDGFINRLISGKRVQFRSGWSFINLKNRIENINPDILHIHWTQDGFCNPISLLNMDLPVVWTLHDLWPLTGGCFYPGSCTNFEVACGRCPLLGSYHSVDLAWWNWNQKKKAVMRTKRLHLTAPSTWCVDLAKRSSVMGGVPVSLVPNIIDTEVFNIRDKFHAREKWKLPKDKKLVLFSAADAFMNPQKGFFYVNELMKRLEGTDLVVLGAGSGHPSFPSYRIHNIGYVSSDEEMADIYAAVDVVLVPSAYETFGLVAAEAAACGKPVIGFATSGLLDVVVHGKTGYLAAPKDTEDLFFGVKWLLDDADRYIEICEQARSKAVSCYDGRLIAEKLRSVYSAL